MGFLRRLFRRDGLRPLAGRADQWGAQGGMGGQWRNPGTGMGGPLDGGQADEFHPGIPIDRYMADALLQFNPQARRIAAQEAEDATREGYDLVQCEAGIADAVEQACEGGDTGKGLGLLGCVAEARTWARAYGGGAVVVLVDDGRPNHAPIDRANIRRVRGLRSATRWDLPVTEWGGDPNEARTFNRPRIYTLQINGGRGGQSMRVHADRVVRLRGLPLPSHLMLQRQGWDGSAYDLAFAALRGYGTTHVQVVEAVRKLNQGVLTSPALTDGLEGEDGGAAFQARLDFMAKAMGIYGEVALGKEETYAIHNRSLAGLDAAVAAAKDHLVAASDGMPKLVLLGEVTAGFSNASDGELRAWYDACAAKQPKIYTPALRPVIDLVMLSHEGPTGGRLIPYGVEWRPLYALSEKEQAERDEIRARRRATDIASTAVSRDEARREPSLTELYGPLDDAPLDPGIPGQEPVDSALADTPDDEPEREGVVSLVAAQPSVKPMPPDLLDPREAAAMAGISTNKLRRLMRSGELEFWSWGGTDRVSAAALAAMGSSHHAA